MILIFLGSWRSTVIIAVSIPLSILTSIMLPERLGETINIMTLGGLALAVGILVDDATVRSRTSIAIWEGQGSWSTRFWTARSRSRCRRSSRRYRICIVFVPMFFLTGVARYLFVPLAEAVVVRDARVVPAVANAGADHGEVSAARSRSRSWTRVEGQQKPVCSDAGPL